MMKILEAVVLLMLFVLLFGGLYLLWLNYPQEPTEFERYVRNSSLNLPQESQQFHPNMRYQNSSISYFISSNCSEKKKNDFIDATALIESKTILHFYPSNKPDILVSCSNVAPEPEESGHFVAGEGGPSVILNSTKYAVILLGKVALYRAETCNTPQVAAHEILHALGFDHNKNPMSIMFPVTNCNQEIDQDIIDEIDMLYSVPPFADLVIESVEANKTGRYLNFEVVVGNYGLYGVKDSNLKVYVDGSLLREFDTENIDIGSRRTLTISNLKVPSNTREFSLVVEASEPEISLDNNRAKISVAG